MPMLAPTTTATSSRDKQRAGQELVEAKTHLSERFVSHMPTGGHAVIRYDLRAARREGGFGRDLVILKVATRVNLLPAVWDVRVLPVLLRSATGGSAWSCRQHCAVLQLAPEATNVRGHHLGSEMAVLSKIIPHTCPARLGC